MKTLALTQRLVAFAALVVGLGGWSAVASVSAQTTQVEVGDRLIVPITFTSEVPVATVRLQDVSFSNAQLISLQCGGSGLTVSQSVADGCTVLAPTASTGAEIAKATIDVISPGLVQMSANTTFTTVLGTQAGGTLTAPTYQAVAADTPSTTTNPGSSNNSTTTNSTTSRTTETSEGTTTTPGAAGGSGGSVASQTSDDQGTLTLDSLIAALKRNPWAWGIGGLLLLILIIAATWYLASRRNPYKNPYR